MDSMTPVSGMPAVTPTSKLVSSKATKACNLTFITRNSRRKIPATAVRINPLSDMIDALDG